jgi:hypothetical protein
MAMVDGNVEQFAFCHSSDFTCKLPQIMQQIPQRQLTGFICSVSIRRNKHD